MAYTVPIPTYNIQCIGISKKIRNDKRARKRKSGLRACYIENYYFGFDTINAEKVIIG